MRKFIALCTFVAMTGVVAAGQRVNTPTRQPFNELPKEEQKARIEAAREHRLQRTGGEVSREGSQKGKVLFLNAQSIVPEAELATAVETLGAKSKLNIVLKSAAIGVSPQNAGELKKSEDADIVVFIVADEQNPIMLLNAPENGWAIVNASVVAQAAKNDVFRAARLRKEAMRAFFSVAGAMNSNFPNSLMRAIRKPSDLDKTGEDIPLDAYGRTMENLKTIGVTPTETTTYLQACRLGWAPPPTNDYQRAIWEQVRSIPINPIKIEFDPAKGK